MVLSPQLTIAVSSAAPGVFVDVGPRRIDETEIPRRPTVAIRQTRLGRADKTWIIRLRTAFRDPVESLHTAMAHHIPKKEKFAFERRKIAAGLVAFGHGSASAEAVSFDMMFFLERGAPWLGVKD